jgi:hypothetical protein
MKRNGYWLLKRIFERWLWKQWSESSIGKGGSGAGGALELHPLRHQDIISYQLHVLVMYLKSVDQWLLAF